MRVKEKSHLFLEEIKLLGLAVRTNNKQEPTPGEGKIGLTMKRFFSDNIGEQIQNKKNSGRIFSVYTDYESDHTGDYTYFIGEEVTTFPKELGSLKALIIPSQYYIKFTSSPGPLPTVVIDIWQYIWQLSTTDLLGKRAYKADFEVYDERCHNPLQAVVDIYVGLITA